MIRFQVVIWVAFCMWTAESTVFTAEEAYREMSRFPFLNITTVFELFLHNAYDIVGGQPVINCTRLFQKQLADLDQSLQWPPPQSIPEDKKEPFTLRNIIPVGNWYFAEESKVAERVWSAEEVEIWREKENTCGGYNVSACKLTLDRFHDAIRDKHGLVVGSQTPWAEGSLLQHNVSRITTVEYVSLHSEHPQINSLHVRDLANRFLNGSWEPVDFIFSFSSIEHDGLGRYGDPLNPFGDIESLSRMHCLLRDEGLVFLGVPYGDYDMLIWNAHRVYGRHRMRLLLQSQWWTLIDTENGGRLRFNDSDPNATLIEYEEAMWVLQKVTSKSNDGNLEQEVTQTGGSQTG